MFGNYLKLKGKICQNLDLLFQDAALLMIKLKRRYIFLEDLEKIMKELMTYGSLMGHNGLK